MSSLTDEVLLTAAKEVAFDIDGPLFNGSPLPSRRTLHSDDHFQKFKETDKNAKPLYPNYDGTIWTRPNEKEVLAPQSGVVIGTIPQWLNGTLVRNGSGMTKFGKDEYKHVFDCPALIHKFTIKDGVVTYQSRYLDTTVYERNKAEQRIVVSEFGTKSIPDPCRTLLRRFACFFTTQASDNTNVSIYPFGDEICALGDMPVMKKINIDTLNITESKRLAKSYLVVHHTSHPHVESDGTVYNLGMSANRGTFHQILKFPINEEGKPMFDNVEVVASVPARWPLNPSYMHSFGMTKNYFIIIEQPCTIYVPRVALKRFGVSIMSCFRWYENEYTRVSIISRETGQVHRTFYTDPFFYVHTINHYEDGDNIVLDVSIYRDPYVFEIMYIDALETMQNNPEFKKILNRAVRYVFPLNPKPDANENENLVELKNTKAKAFYLGNGNILAKPEKLSDISCDMPRFNYDFMGKKYRYCYGICFDFDSEYAGNVVKIDTENKISKAWGQKGYFPSEPIFVPRPDAQEEDDGIILTSVVYESSNSNKIALVILDGKSLNEIGRVEIKTPGDVRQGFHGWFFPDKEQ